MEYLFVDFENIAPETVSELHPDQTVLIFAGKKQKMKTDLVQSMMDRGPNAKFVQIRGDGKNALDFHIAFYLGKLSESDKDASFRILSKDKGFDALVSHLKSLKLDCARIEDLPNQNPPRIAKQPAKKRPKEDLQSKLDSFIAHLNEMTEKARPKKASKLKAYLKHWDHKNDLMVESLFQGLITEKQIEVDGEKIKYIGAPAK